MGNDGTETQNPLSKLLIGAAVVGVGLYFAKKILTTVEGEGM
jgi:hypothetical protein